MDGKQSLVETTKNTMKKVLQDLNPDRVEEGSPELVRGTEPATSLQPSADLQLAACLEVANVVEPVDDTKPAASLQQFEDKKQTDSTESDDDSKLDNSEDLDTYLELAYYLQLPTCESGLCESVSSYEESIESDLIPGSTKMSNNLTTKCMTETEETNLEQPTLKLQMNTLCVPLLNSSKPSTSAASTASAEQSKADSRPRTLPVSSNQNTLSAPIKTQTRKAQIKITPNPSGSNAPHDQQPVEIEHEGNPQLCSLPNSPEQQTVGCCSFLRFFGKRTQKSKEPKKPKEPKKTKPKKKWKSKNFADYLDMRPLLKKSLLKDFPYRKMYLEARLTKNEKTFKLPKNPYRLPIINRYRFRKNNSSRKHPPLPMKEILKGAKNPAARRRLFFGRRKGGFLRYGKSSSRIPARNVNPNSAMAQQVAFRRKQALAVQTYLNELYETTKPQASEREKKVKGDKQKDKKRTKGLCENVENGMVRMLKCKCSCPKPTPSQTSLAVSVEGEGDDQHNQENDNEDKKTITDIENKEPENKETDAQIGDDQPQPPNNEISSNVMKEEDQNGTNHEQNEH